MIAIIVVAAFAVVALALGVLAYRRSLGSGSYTGSMSGAIGVATMLGTTFGLAVALVTLDVVLVIRELR